jgi:large subunit ribosomal protein L24e
MPTCSFCKKNYEIPRGLTVFQFDGKSVHFCSSKCKRNSALKRDPKKVNWVKREKKSNETAKIETQKEKPVEKVEKKQEKPAQKTEKSSEKIAEKKK